ncbi:MAG: hypothetical protein EOO06_07610 [Chitinophagaceae bacterium]|nr:MAG: hypothetical protein EOO06_07610 [Chitinophagaceae bacterium]
MDNIGRHIVAQQNNEHCIRELSAQRQIYSEAKLLFYLQIIIAVPIPIAISFIQVFSSDAAKLSWLFAFYSIVASILEIFIEAEINKKKQTAATIQEQFDCDVLYIPWNKVLVKEKAKPEVVFKSSNKFQSKSNLDRLYNWYSPLLEKVGTNAATLIAQRTNCTYDFSLRKKFNYIILSLALCTLAVTIWATLAIGFSMQTFFSNIALPMLPITLVVIKQIRSNNESLTNLEELREIIESYLENIVHQPNIPVDVIRQVQDKIYCNRTTSPLMPDALYSWLWSELEEAMAFSTQTKIDELRIKP